jgi:hypothetical protein
MKIIIFAIVVIVMTISYFGGNWLIKYLTKDNKKENEGPKELQILEEEVIEKTESYKDVVGKIEDVEVKVKNIKKKSEVKK